MLQTRDAKVIEHAFLIAVEIETDGPTSVDEVKMRMKEGVNFMEGVGKIDVTYMGKMEREGLIECE